MNGAEIWSAGKRNKLLSVGTHFVCSPCFSFLFCCIISMRHYPVAQNVAKSPARGVGCKLIGSVFKGAANKLSMSYQFSFYISIAHTHARSPAHRYSYQYHCSGRKRDADVSRTSWGAHNSSLLMACPNSELVWAQLRQLSCNCSPLIAFVCQAELFTFIIISTRQCGSKSLF